MNSELQKNMVGNDFLDGTKGHVIFTANKQTRLSNCLPSWPSKFAHWLTDLTMTSLSAFNQDVMEEKSAKLMDNLVSSL